MSSRVSKSHGSNSKGKSSKETPNKEKSTKKSSKEKSSKEKSKKGSRDDEQTYIELYCAIYTPEFGNYYHWAFATHNQQTRQWYIFEVVQDEQDGPFSPEQHQTDPRNSRRCHRPLTPLGFMDPGWWDTLIQQIGTIQVPGEAASWNCQDYVMEIWDIMRFDGMIDDNTWYGGRENMLPYFGPDFGGADGGADDDGGGEGGGEEEGNEGPEGRGGRGPLSEEFILDSSE